MTRKCTIRKAGLWDIPAVFAIEKESFPTPWSHLTFLAELNQSISHFLLIGPAPPTPWQVWGYVLFWVVADEMHLLNLAVHPGQRGRGLGRALLSEALRQAQDQKAQVAWLEVRPSNAAALALYASFGFKEVGRRPKYYEDTNEDAILLALYWEEES